MLRFVTTIAILLAGGLQALATGGFQLERDCPIYVASDSAFGSFGNIAAAAGIVDDQVVRLATVARTVEEGDTMAALIADNGFRPDQFNLALAAHLNPHIRDIARLDQGSLIHVPVVEAYSYDAADWQVLAFETPLDGFAVDVRVAPQIARETEAAADLVGNRLSVAIGQPRFELAADLLAAMQEAVPAQNLTGWRSPGEFLTTYEPRIVQSVRATRTTAAILEAAEETQGAVEISFLSQTPSLFDRYRFDRSPGTVNLTLKVYDVAGTPLDGLEVRYMGKGSYDNGCPREYAVPFSRGTYEARESLARARFMFWVHDTRTGRWSRPFEHDLQRESNILTLDHMVDWDDD